MLLTLASTSSHYLSPLHYMETADSFSKPSSSSNEVLTGDQSKSFSSAPVEDMAALSATPSTRPRLTLQTESLPSPYFKRSAGLALPNSAVDSTTPTTLNTIANGKSLDISLRHSPVVSPSQRRAPNTPLSRPYVQPFNVRSILKNGLITSPLAPSSATNRLGKRSFSLFSSDTGSPQKSRRVFFPAVKRVHFEKEDKLAVEITARPKKKRKFDAGDENGLLEDRKKTDALDGHTAEEPFDGEEESAAGLADSGLRNCRERSFTPPLQTNISDTRKRAKIRRWEWTIGVPINGEKDVGSGSKS